MVRVANIKFTFSLFAAWILKASLAQRQRERPCEILSMFAFSNGGDPTDLDLDPVIHLGRRGWFYTAAAELAIDHFNNRSPLIVPELAELEDCNATISRQIILDSQFTEPDVPAAEFTLIYDKDDPFCAVLGPHREGSNGVSILTDAYSIPHLSYSEFRRAAPRSKNFLGLSVEADTMLKPMADFMRRPQFDRDYLAVLHMPSASLTAVAIGLDSIRDDLEIFRVQKKSAAGDEWNLDMELVKNSGITTIMIVASVRVLMPIVPFLEDFGMLNGDYVFILQTGALNLEIKNFEEVWGAHEPGSPVDRFLNGAIFFSTIDPFMFDQEDPLRNALKSQDSSFISRVNDRVPISENMSMYAASDDIFETEELDDFTSYVYDSVIAVGIGKCIAETEGFRGPLSIKIKTAEFNGASGFVTFTRSGPRPMSPIGAFNVRASDIDSATGLRSYRPVLTSVWLEDSWEDIEGEAIVYHNGLTTPPVASINVKDANYLPRYARTVGLSLLAIAWISALGLVSAVIFMRKDSVIRASQPIFQVAICLASVFLSTSILTLSFDESYGASQVQLEAACKATPWFFFMGQNLTYAALFTKLWRVDRVVQFHRASVKLAHVVLPLGFLILLTSLILLVWTVVDPWTWERVVVQEIPLETYGQCTNDSFMAYFGPLAAVMIAAELAAAYFAHKTKDLPEPLRDTNFVFYALCTNLQAWLVGFPLLAVLGESSVVGTYIGRVTLIFILSVTAIYIVVGPRVYGAIRMRLDPEFEEFSSRNRVIISGLGRRKRSFVQYKANQQLDHCPHCQKRLVESNNEPTSSSLRQNGSVFETTGTDQLSGSQKLQRSSGRMSSSGLKSSTPSILPPNALEKIDLHTIPSTPEEASDNIGTQGSVVGHDALVDEEEEMDA